MPSDTQRYPLSTPEGSAIPLEIMKPHSFIRKTFDNVIVTAAIAVPANIEILSISVTEDCLVCFGANAVTPVDGTAYANTVLVEANVRVCVAPRASTFTLLGLSAAGVANLQFVEKWAGLALSKQLSGR